MGPHQRVWSRAEIAERIVAGENLVILQGQVLRVPPSWLVAHPGGSLAILHFVGRDATDEIEAYHPVAVLDRMKRYVVGIVDVGKRGWIPLLPPVQNGWVRRIGDSGTAEWHREAEPIFSSNDTPTSARPSTEILLIHKDTPLSLGRPSVESLEPLLGKLSLDVQTEHARAYRELHDRVTEAGLYQCRYFSGYGPEVARYLTLAGLTILAFSKGWFITSAAALGFLWQQLAFVCHDLGHNGVTHNWLVDRVIGTSIANFIGGISLGWWVDVSVTHFVITATVTDPEHPES
jgi:sphingolipid 8-(E)-desaturase